VYPKCSTEDAEKGENNPPMPRETEVKFLDVDHEELESRILDEGGKKVFEGPVFAEYFNGLPGKKNLTIRLRKKGDLVELATKRRRKNKYEERNVRDCDELQVEVSDFDEMKEILLKIGLQSLRTVTKDRVAYVLGQAKIDADRITDPEGVPPFAEVEAARVKIIRSTSKLLGLDWKERKGWSTRGVLEYYGIE
jgi:predicted adenylyl cyclase CyaB